MTSLNVPSESSGCDCSFEPVAIELFLKSFFPMDIGKLITYKMNPSEEYRVMHSVPGGPPHALCQKCEEYQEHVTYMMDTNMFTCPHSGCRRYIFTG